MRTRDRGQVVPLMVVVLVVVAVVLAMVVRLSAVTDRAAQARTAADAAALAGAAEGCDGARRMAAANGAVLERCEQHGPTVTVEVRIDDVRARARALASTTWELAPRREVGVGRGCRRLPRCPMPSERAASP